MPEAVFFRLLSDAIDEKGQALQARIAELNAGDTPTATFTVSDEAFKLISRSPFAYWASKKIREVFSEFGNFQSDEYKVCFGLSTKNNFRFLRLFWETQSSDLNQVWFPLAKGGAYSPFYYDIHLVIDWETDGKRLKAFANERTQEIFGTPSWSRWINNWNDYYRPGLTYPLRTQKGLSVRAMSSGCIFADKGPAIFVTDDDPVKLLSLLGVTNSTLFRTLIGLQMAFGSYEVGVIQRTPVPDDLGTELAPLAQQAHDLQREKFIHDETTHVFTVPGLAAWRGTSLNVANMTLEELADQRQQTFADVQVKIDTIVFDLYGLNQPDREAVMAQSAPVSDALDELEQNDEAAEDSDDEDEATTEGLVDRAQNLLMWCVGVVFGRWDVRKALDPALLPALPQPFDPLPRCAPGALMDADGLPLTQNDVPVAYPLAIAWDNILVDDPAQEYTPHSLDIVAKVRQVLTLLWAEQAHRIEDELCQILGMQNLRDYFRHPTKGFFAFHIKRYSKSRRKAPIYWLLQSAKKNTALWFYYPRMVADTLFIGEDILYKKARLEQTRLEEFKQGLAAFSGAERKKHERSIELQTRLVEDVNDFYAVIRRLATLKLPPDHNDGVLLSIAPLHEVVPWKEASAMWQKLVRGEFAWSGISAQLRHSGFINSEES